MAPVGAEVMSCRVGEVWANLLAALETVSWNSIDQDLVGVLYEVIVDSEYRHQLGLHYTREDVVDLLTTFAVSNPGDIVMDPASGGGSFLRAAHKRKRSLGEDHESALSTTWGAEVTAFAAELSTITLATADTDEPAAYPRVLLQDFFSLRPGIRTELKIPEFSEVLRLPVKFDAIIGNPPYISYRHQTNQTQVLNALASASKSIAMPKFSGKSDEYVWFIAHATGFIRIGGRLAFVVSSAILFADYGIPLIRFLSLHYRIRAVIDSIVERWFIDADTNTVLLLLERDSDVERRARNGIRFIRFRKPLAQLLPEPSDLMRRDALEELVDEIITASNSSLDPRFMVTIVEQGRDGGLASLTRDGDVTSRSRTR